MNEHIFISHATPEDNEFSIWLASRLEMMGYNVWIDKDNLLGGERFWPTIQKAVQNSSKVLLVYSKHIVTEEGVLKQGVENEIEYAKSIANGRQDYLIPLHIDDSGFNLAIGLPSINQIPFNQNWAEGLKQLVRKLEKDQVPKNNEISSSFTNWYENEYISKCSIIAQKELYYSSWWTVKEMPLTFFMYQFETREQAKAVCDNEINQTVPISLQSNVLVTFEKELNFQISKDGQTFEIKPKQIYSFKIHDICSIDSKVFPTQIDVENSLKRFLKLLISKILKNKGRRDYKLANKNYAYYLPAYRDEKAITIEYKFSKKTKKKSIFGKYKNIGNWHYAISVYPMLYPFFGYSIKPHILFSSDGFKIIEDDKKTHSYRREKGSRFFNEEWRDMYLAFIQGIIDIDGEIKIKVTRDNEYFKMKLYPEFFWSEVGYNDPQSRMSIEHVENYLNEDDEND